MSGLWALPRAPKGGAADSSQRGKNFVRFSALRQKRGYHVRGLPFKNGIRRRASSPAARPFLRAGRGVETYFVLYHKFFGKTIDFA